MTHKWKSLNDHDCCKVCGLIRVVRKNSAYWHTEYITKDGEVLKMRPDCLQRQYEIWHLVS